MKAPIEIIAERVGKHEAAAVVDLLRESGWLIFRHDAIRQAQADEREYWAQFKRQSMEINK